jgi:hypothetical protein
VERERRFTGRIAGFHGFRFDAVIVLEGDEEVGRWCWRA